ncbi:hypothetical protein [Actinomycetospora sp. NBC_00405]|uniref:hypothetical protein n=1 Tax=Actinomycetospora sp. NBC_00405 TaxID=2975952 RepID=UPI002E24700F
MSDGEGPSFPDWLEAISTALAVALTSITLVYLARQGKLQKEQRELEEQTLELARVQDRRKQASLITVKLDRADSRTATFKYKVENRSGVPCYFTFFEILMGTSCTLDASGR